MKGARVRREPELVAIHVIAGRNLVAHFEPVSIEQRAEKRNAFSGSSSSGSLAQPRAQAAAQ